jgi:aminopeptidase N
MIYEIIIPENEELGYGTFSYTEGILCLAYSYPMISKHKTLGNQLVLEHGDFLYNDLSYYLVQITMPRNLVMATSGILISEKENDNNKTIIYASGPARDFFMAGSTEYICVIEEVGETEVLSYSKSNESELSEKACEFAADSIKIFNQIFGPYPYRKFSIITLKTAALGIEFPGIAGNAKRLYEPGSIVSGIPAEVMLEGTTVHEVSHQWFYNLIGNDQIKEPWIDEAMAQYSTWVYYREKYGENNASGFFQSFYGRWDRIDRKQMPIALPVQEYTEKEYGAIVYGLGPIFIKILSEEIGENKFREFLKQYYNNYKWKIVTRKNYTNLIESVSEKNLEELFSKWLDGN